LAACPAMESYKPTPWIIGPHANTLYGVFMRKSPGLSYHRVYLPLGDGGAVAIDWHTLPRTGQPVLLLQHGLTGGSEERYVQWMVKTASERLGVCCVVMNARGCSNTSLLTPQSFSAAWTHDIRETVKYIRGIIGPTTPLFGIGYSLGAGILLKYVAEEGDACTLSAAIACCGSLDMFKSKALLHQPLALVTYNKRMASSLGKFLKRHEHQFAHVEWMDLPKAYAARTVADFDTATIVPMFRYPNVDAYYEDASTAKHIHKIRVPTLLLNAQDDPICATDGVPLPAVEANPCVISVMSAEGGHVAWVQGMLPTGVYWDNDVVTQYIPALLKLRGYKWTEMEMQAARMSPPHFVVPVTPTGAGMGTMEGTQMTMVDADEEAASEGGSPAPA
jgi:predicted alpha/beta-fold hydrolase